MTSNDNKYNRRLMITIPGSPVVDGRPRENRKLEVFYNEKKALLKTLFREIYKRDDVLQTTCVITPHKCTLKLFYLPNKDELKYLTNDELNQEDIDSISAKDNDNVEKVHWDVLQDGEFSITLNDSNTSRNETMKVYSFMPRTEIIIDYNSEFTHPLYEYKIKKSINYKLLVISKKYTKDKMKMDDIQTVKFIIKQLEDGGITTVDNKKLKYVLIYYSDVVINLLYMYYKFKISNLSTPNENALLATKRIKKNHKIDYICNRITTKNRGDKHDDE